MKQLLLITLLLLQTSIHANENVTSDSDYTKGMKYYLGIGVDQDTVKGLSILTQECDLNIYTSCRTIGTIYEYGNLDTLVDQDFVKAQAYFAKACLGNKDNLSCEKYNQLEAEAVAKRRNK